MQEASRCSFYGVKGGGELFSMNGSGVLMNGNGRERSKKEVLMPSSVPKGLVRSLSFFLLGD